MQLKKCCTAEQLRHNTAQHSQQKHSCVPSPALSHCQGRQPHTHFLSLGWSNLLLEAALPTLPCCAVHCQVSFGANRVHMQELC